MTAILYPLYAPHRPSSAAIDGRRLYQLHMGVLTYFNESGSENSPGSWWTLIEQGLVPEDCLVSARVRSGRASRLIDEARQQASATQAGGSEWEALGQIMLSREIEAFEDFPSGVIVGHFLYPSFETQAGMPIRVLFLFADMSVQVVPVQLLGRQPDAYDRLIAIDRDTRQELGLNEPPDYAAVIREYMEAEGAH